MKPAFDFDVNDLYFALSASVDEYIILTDCISGYSRVSKALRDEFGFEDEYIKDFPLKLARRIHHDDFATVKGAYRNVERGMADSYCAEYRIKNALGNWIWIREHSTIVRDGFGKILNVASAITNLGRRNNTDHTTGLLNKYEFESYVNLCIHQNLNIGIMIMNIDDFKNINNLYSRQFGDNVLRIAAQHIQNAVPTNAKVFRLDGDEFGIVFIDHLKSDIKQIYSNICNHFSTQREYQGKKYYCTFSAGCCKFNEQNNTFDILVKNSHTALDHAKAKGKSKIIFFEQKLSEHKTRELKLTELLRESIENDFRDFELFCQPQVFASNGKLKGGEALLRWRTDEFGPISPAEFIPILENTNMIVPVGKWVFERALTICKEWLKFCPDFMMSINVSYIQLYDENFLDFVKKTIKRIDIPTSHIIVEFTESCFVTDKDMLHSVFNSIRELGMKIAMDDFGTGYSSLEILKEVPADIVKIDKAFVRNIQSSKFDKTFIRFVVELCHDVDIQVCLEGVETCEELEIISQMGLDFIQGYYFGKPLDTTNFYETFFRNTVA